MKADAYLPVWVRYLPINVGFTPMGRLKPNIRHYVDQGVVRVIADALHCHLRIDVNRPYFRPETLLESAHIDLEEVL